MPLRGSRDDHFAGQWYDADPSVLSAKLDGFLAAVPDAIDGISLPVPRARVVIAPHAGYKFSGPCAAWAYKCLDLSAAKRVFILGPSHQYSLPNCALTTFEEYETRFGSLAVDETVVTELQNTGEFSKMPRSMDVLEHSLEMHIPYLWKRLEQTHGEDIDKWPTIVPILVGSTNRKAEKKFGSILLPYLKDPENAFIISSDFCHWGSGFSYQSYFSLAAARRLAEAEKRRRAAVESGEMDEEDESEEEIDLTNGHELVRLNGTDGAELVPVLVSHVRAPRHEDDMPFHESIKILDDQAIAAIKTGVHDNFVENLRQTGNTVCGRHPIGVMMAALEQWREEQAPSETASTPDGTNPSEHGIQEERGRFKFVQYDRSCLAKKSRDSSVSYVSAYTIP